MVDTLEPKFGSDSPLQLKERWSPVTEQELPVPPLLRTAAVITRLPPVVPTVMVPVLPDSLVIAATALTSRPATTRTHVSRRMVVPLVLNSPFVLLARSAAS